MNRITLHELALLAMQGVIETLRFASDGRTAVIKFREGDSKILTEKRIIPEKGSDGVDRYDVTFLNT